MDRAIHAADHAADRARLARKLIEQYNFRMKVVGEHDAKVAQMAQLLSDADHARKGSWQTGEICAGSGQGETPTKRDPRSRK